MTNGERGGRCGAAAVVLAIMMPGAGCGQQAQRVHVEWSELVTVDDPDRLHVESWLAVSPVDADHLVATVMVPGEGGSLLYVSRDGGRAWSRATEEGTGAPDFDGFDPVVEFAPDGTPYFATLADGFTVWRGEDGGDTWRRMGIVPGGSYDRQWIHFDGSDGPHHGRIHTAGKVWIQVLGTPARDVAAFSSSDDRGETFRQAQLVLPDPTEGALNVLTRMIVLPDGSLAAAYQFFRWEQREQDGVLDGDLQILRSRDGRTWEGPFTAGALRVHGNSAEQSLMIKGLGGGHIVVEPDDGDRMHATWTRIEDGFLQVVLASSSDGGRSWGETTRVNDGGLRSNHSNPSIAVNASGEVAVVWNDRRDDSSDRCFRPYVTVSVDRGHSFLPSVPLTASPVCPPAGRWLNGGDTQGIVALPDGTFQMAWIGPAIREAGPLQLWTSRVAVR